jgi:nucleotide-binding universal stress UspA family protein
MIKRILVTIDGSHLAEDVLPHVEDLARRLPAEVYLLEVTPLHPSTVLVGALSQGNADVGLLYEELEIETQAARARLARLASDWQAKGIAVTWEVIRGEAAHCIVDFAHSREVDLIAMSTHGRSGLSRLVFGSVAAQVIREAGLPVMVIRPFEETANPSGSSPN